ncbi:phosphoadenylyl-sulfate reductase [Bacillus sinesaloumensis]|uniref:phosphoadenylyl-sulfate reductase n=1 Tax=Litchfieldia sinesaloumensis TaxID=1926280 RepID=UPI0009887C5F|nr:phosphoadenylyl-sulfate reductase [Bacillus sinesaloumensis]
MSAITYENWNEKRVKEVTEANKDYYDILKWAYQAYSADEIVYACSFGAEGIVLIDLLSKVNKGARIVFLDTGLHFKETYELIDKIKEKYPTLQIELKKPTLDLNAQANLHGDELWMTNPNLCCQIRKIEPLQEVLNGSKAWISGLRREQGPTRKNTEYLNKDEKFKNIKICPLIHWTWDDVWNYIKLNNLPYNELHDNHYPSIGCAPCTNQVLNGDLRSGRWANSTKTECGLHVKE